MRIFFSVGEPSGDLHGANLIRALCQRRGDLQVTGFGGPRMAAAGCELVEDLTQFAVMWFLRAALQLPHFLRLLRRAEACFRHQRPEGVVLIDYPGFNWWIARRAKRHGIPVVYYSAPQLWAWAPWRIRKMRRYVDQVLCLLPFEEDWYRRRGCQATYVGHPYFDELGRQTMDGQFLAEQRALPGRLVTILPGSRTQEVVSNLPAFLKAAAKVREQVPDVRFAVAAFHEKQAAFARAQVRQARLVADVFAGRTPELIRLAHSCMACSGSVSLELLYHEKPAVILYSINPIAFAAQRALRTVKYITLVNLLASRDPFPADLSTYDPDRPGSEAVPFPEYLTYRDVSGRMARHLVAWLCDAGERDRRVQQLRQLKQRLGQPGASGVAAEFILDWLSGLSRGALQPAAA